ncbi:I78 family peptidase inhibitor [Halocynthiibacter sp.]|uniref:I78 family peptidase inhibitor n=1 Tax=Halocynthiibacter sp. TaxID=1979210 RepID=UPI003C59C8A1
MKTIPVSESPVRYLVLTAGAGLSLLTACQTSQTSTPLPGGTEFRCAAGELQGLVGQPETVLESMSFGPSVWLRVLHPDDAMTLDYQVNRTNIAIAENGIISDIHCS